MHFIALFAAAALAAGPDSFNDGPLTIEAVLSRVERSNAGIAEAQSRASASAARAREAGRLPVAMARVQQWNAPISRPLALNEADSIMVGAEQTFPLPPRLSLRREAQRAIAAAAGDARAAATNHARAEARRAFYEYWRATRDLEIHIDHAKLAATILATARAQYAAGNGRQQDVLRAGLEQQRLHAEIEEIRQEIATAQASLRALMSLDADALLGAPVLGDRSPEPPDLATLEARLAASQPEVRAAEWQERAAGSAKRLADVDAFVPDLTVSADYWANTRMRDGWMAMLAIDLPWLSGARRDARRAAAFDLAAARAAKTGARNAAAASLHDAHARAIAAAGVERLYAKEILPLAEQSEESVHSAWVSGTASFLELLDASRNLIDARVSANRARVRYEESIADLELAFGGPLPTRSP